MSFTANFYTFKKKVNSTLLPSSTPTTYNIELVDDCSIIAPIIRLRGSSASDMLGRFNYCYISTFNRYYFVTDASYDSDRGIWNMSLRSDVLASARSDILASTQFVERSASTFDSDVEDTLYPSKNGPDYWIRTVQAFFDATPSNGQYIIGMVSKGSSASRFGGVQYYILTYAQMNALIDYMMSIVNYADASTTGISTELLGMISNPIEYIVSCKFFPKTLIDLTGMSTTIINFGSFQSTCYGYPLPATFLSPTPVIHSGFYIQLDDHPQAALRGRWLNSNTHTERTLRFEPFGVIPIDSSRLIGYSHIYCDVATDIITGQGILSIYASTQGSTPNPDLTTLPLQGSYASEVLIDIPLTQQRHQGYLQVAESFLRPVLNAGMSASKSMASFQFLGAIADIGNLVPTEMMTAYDAATSFYGAPQSSGTPGSLLCRMNVYLVTKCVLLVEESIGRFGKPLCTNKLLSTLSGFTKCLSPTIATDLTATENEYIVKHMSSGFFIDT